MARSKRRFRPPAPVAKLLYGQTKDNLGLEKDDLTIMKAASTAWVDVWRLRPETIEIKEEEERLVEAAKRLRRTEPAED